MLIHLQCGDGHTWKVARWSPGIMSCPVCGGASTGHSTLEIAQIDRDAKEARKVASEQEQAQAMAEQRAQIALRH